MQVQEFLGRRILIENLSPYLQFRHNSLTEWQFVVALLIEADCDFGLVLVRRVAKSIVNRLKATRLQVLDVYNR